jgi:hypothetical protein
MGKLRGWLEYRTTFQAEQDLKCYIELFRDLVRFTPRKGLCDDVLAALSMKTLSWSMGKVGQSYFSCNAFNLRT